MSLIANLVVGLVAFIHFAVGILEMFFWIRPTVLQQLRPKVDINENEIIGLTPNTKN